MHASPEKKSVSTEFGKEIVIGTVGKPHGLKGEIYVHLMASVDYLALPKFSQLYIGSEVFEVASKRPHKQGFLVFLKGIDIIEKAEPLKGKPVTLQRQQFMNSASEVRQPSAETSTAAAKDEKDFYLFEVLGYQVLDLDQLLLGTIQSFETTDLQDRAVLAIENDTYTVPFVKKLIVARNDQEKTLVMALPQGLRELNQPNMGS